MTDTEADPIADRAAQLEAAYAAYSTGLDAVRARQKHDAAKAAMAADAAERGLFAQYAERVKRITGHDITDPILDGRAADEADRADNDKHSDNDTDA